MGVPPVSFYEAFQFLKSPANVTLSLGKPVQVVCSLQGDGGGEEPPDVVWLRDGQSLDYADTNQVQVPVTEGGWLTISELRSFLSMTLSLCLRYVSRKQQGILFLVICLSVCPQN